MSRGELHVRLIQRVEPNRLISDLDVRRPTKQDVREPYEELPRVAVSSENDGNVETVSRRRQTFNGLRRGKYVQGRARRLR